MDIYPFLTLSITKAFFKINPYPTVYQSTTDNTRNPWLPPKARVMYDAWYAIFRFQSLN